MQATVILAGKRAVIFDLMPALDPQECRKRESIADFTIASLRGLLA